MNKTANNPTCDSCNIQGKGKVARLVVGMLLVLGSLSLMSLILLHLIPANSYAWWMAGSMLAIGSFMIYEGWTGWCVLRAMGIHTPF